MCSSWAQKTLLLPTSENKAPYRKVECLYVNSTCPSVDFDLSRLFMVSNARWMLCKCLLSYIIQRIMAREKSLYPFRTEVFSSLQLVWFMKAGSSEPGLSRSFYLLILLCLSFWNGFFIIILCAHVSICMHWCVLCVCSAWGNQKRSSGNLELEF